MARDISFTFNGWKFNLTDDEKDVFLGTGNEIPTSTLEITTPRIILGGAWVKQFTPKISLVTELDLDFTTDGKRNVLLSAGPIQADPHLGFEARYSDFLFLRGGISNIHCREIIDFHLCGSNRCAVEELKCSRHSMDTTYEVQVSSIKCECSCANFVEVAVVVIDDSCK